MVQKIYDSTANDGQQQRQRPHKCTYSTKAHKNTVCYIPAFWHKSGVFYIGGIFSFFQASKEQANRRVPLTHTQPVLTSATAPHILHTIRTPPPPTQNPTNLIPKPFLFIFTHFCHRNNLQQFHEDHLHFFHV